jgi:hypothetical protein
VLVTRKCAVKVTSQMCVCERALAEAGIASKGCVSGESVEGKKERKIVDQKAPLNDPEVTTSTSTVSELNFRFYNKPLPSSHLKLCANVVSFKRK